MMRPRPRRSSSSPRDGISRRGGHEDGEVEAVSAQDVQQGWGSTPAKVTLPDGRAAHDAVTLHKQVKVELPLKLVEAEGRSSKKLVQL